jgi:hypothetical protein
MDCSVKAVLASAANLDSLSRISLNVEPNEHSTSRTVQTPQLRFRSPREPVPKCQSLTLETPFLKQSRYLYNLGLLGWFGTVMKPNHERTSTKHTDDHSSLPIDKSLTS